MHKQITEPVSGLARAWRPRCREPATQGPGLDGQGQLRPDPLEEIGWWECMDLGLGQGSLWPGERGKWRLEPSPFQNSTPQAAGDLAHHPTPRLPSCQPTSPEAKSNLPANNSGLEVTANPNKFPDQWRLIKKVFILPSPQPGCPNTHSPPTSVGMAPLDLAWSWSLHPSAFFCWS